MDEYLKSVPIGYFFPQARILDVSITEDDIGHFFKVCDPIAEVCVILGQKFRYRPIWDGLKELNFNETETSPYRPIE